MVSHILLRNGKKSSVLFYGGQGGGKKQKSSFLELGHLINIALQRSNHNKSEMRIAKEWKLKWRHEGIHEDYKLFYLVCFYLEVLEKISLPETYEFVDNDNAGLFRVASNALYYLEEAIAHENVEAANHATIFFGKLLFETGVAPILENCLYCEKDLENGEHVTLLFDEGGFTCQSCQHQSEHVLEVQGLREILLRVRNTPYKNYAQFSGASMREVQQLFRYLCYQFDLKENQFKTTNMVFH